MNDRPAALSYVAPVFRVTDLARSIRFYREQLGFELDFSYEDFYASVHRDACYIHLRCAAPAPRDQARFRARRASRRLRRHFRRGHACE